MCSSDLALVSRGAWLPLGVLVAALLFVAAWSLRASVLGRLWALAAFILACAFLAPFIERAAL